jgi:NADH-quinone oxidoreductase subunit A
MLSFYTEYFNLLVFAFISILIVFILLLLSYIVSPKNVNVEKLSTYECGFEPFDESRKSFDIQFYIVGVLFLIFDIEIAFLFPWAVSLSSIGLFGF